MAGREIADMIWAQLQDEINGLKHQVNQSNLQSERAEVADSIPAATFANLPTAAGGGLGDNNSYTTLYWCSNGRKSTEGVGAGTGILCYWDNTSGTWKGVRSESNVTV